MNLVPTPARCRIPKPSPTDMHHSNFRGGIFMAGGGLYRKVGAQRSTPFGHAVS